MKFSVIIPVLNERPNLEACVASVRRALPHAEVIAVDGGSSDGSVEWLASTPGIRLVRSALGKGPQQNAGAAVADGEVFIFLHADCILPDRSRQFLDECLVDPAVVGGCFYVRFAELRPKSLHFLAWAMNTRARLFRWSYGDQALFVRRAVFTDISGYPDWPLFEDYELVRRFKTCGRFGVVPIPITLSARRFQRYGVWRTLALVLVLHLGFQLGVPPTRLKRWFADVRTRSPECLR